MWLRFYIEGGKKLENLSSIVFHTVTVSMLLKEAKIKKCGFVTIQRTKLEYVSSIVFHTVILKCFEKQCGILSMIHTPTLSSI